MTISIEQIRAARAMKDWGQVELAARAGLTQVTVANIESNRSRGSKESLQAIRTALENAGVEFLEDGVRLTKNSIMTIKGKDSYVRLLDDVHFTLLNQEGSKEVLFFGSDERRSSQEVNNTLRKMRAQGIKFRSLVPNGNNFLLGPLDEYRELPKGFQQNDVTVIYPEKVGFIVEVKPNYEVLLVRNFYVNKDHRQLFEYFWSLGTRPKKTTATESYD